MKEISCVSELVGSPVLKYGSRFTVSEFHDTAHPLFSIARQRLFVRMKQTPFFYANTCSKIESASLKFIFYLKSSARASTFPLELLTSRATVLNFAVKLYYGT